MSGWLVNEAINLPVEGREVCAVVEDMIGLLRHPEPLALMVKDAIEAEVPGHQKALFRQVGDVSLYTAGFFQNSLNRKMVDLDYYIDMGGTAYQRVALLQAEENLRLIFQELASRFSAYVDILAEISAQTSLKNETNLLQMYEYWMKTKSGRAERTLKEAGILPNPAPTTKKVQ
ncbi:MAG: hypothetical protein EOP84_21375 [Verrucomicrobiaceae bacterium]|nr:MAG: hypothetical protein EOP84_21375 [Verrucomicrobiaceae bacterium]